MKYQLSPECYSLLKKLDVGIRNAFWGRMIIFEKNPYDSILDNHELHRNFTGCRSIDIYNNIYVAIYENNSTRDEVIAYFFQIGEKDKLYTQ